MPIQIQIESPIQDDIRVLIAELNAVLLSLTPPEHCHHMTVDQMAGPETTVFIARDNGTPVACGALRRHGVVNGEALGEVKRFYTRPAHQGQGIAGQILARVVAMAQAEGLDRLVLETGDRHPAAWAIYERGGFTRCGPVLDYPTNGPSIFYTKPLNART